MSAGTCAIVRALAVWCCAVVIAAGFIISPAAQSPPPLPNSDEFIAQVRARLRTDDDLQSQYTYLERRQRIRVSRLGKVEVGDTRLFEVYPSPEPGQTYRRLLSIDDVPLGPEELRRRDEAHQKRLADLVVIRSRETPTERARRERAEADARRKQQDVVDDVFRVYRFELMNREVVDTHPAIIVTLTARRGVATRSQPGKYFEKFRGRAWVSEDEYQVMAVELEATENVLIGWGIVARVSKGSRLRFERRKVNDEIWLPSNMRIELAGRALLLRKFRVEAVTQFFDYRRFVVDTRETFTPPQ